jgi:arylsulfatase A-like enzyme
MSKKQIYKKRQFLQYLACVGLFIGLIGFGNYSCIKKQKTPNILLILTDDQGINDVSAYGSEIPTPNIDAIGQNGIRFTNFYTTAPVCTPARYGLLTGRYQYRAAEAFQGPLMPREPKHANVHLAENEVIIAEVLKKAGYKTALIGKWHLGHGKMEYCPNNHGFDTFYGFLPGCFDYYKHSYENDPALFRNQMLVEEDGYATDLFTDEAIRFIEKNKNDPFFLYLSYNAPHYGRCPDGNLLQSPPEYIDIPKKAVKDRDVYAAMVENLDRGIGRVMETLKKLNLKENTIVIFLSDNGGDYDFGGSNKPYSGEKATLWEGGIKVPCVMEWKGHISSGQIIDQPIISLDLFPTLIHLVGVTPPDQFPDGFDIRDVILGNGTVPDRYLFFRFQNQIAVRDKRWKYLKDSNGKEYLFDITKDPYEQENIIAENQKQAQIMIEEYEKFIQRIELQNDE